MNDNELKHVEICRSSVLHPKRIYLGPRGAVALTGACFYQPMYKDLPEVLDLIKIHFERTNHNKLDYVSTFENGMIDESEWVPSSYVGFEVEEYVVYEKGTGEDHPIVRIWPFLLTHDKRIEYRIYTEDRALSKLVSHYLGICAKMNSAKLVLKE